MPGETTPVATLAPAPAKADAAKAAPGAIAAPAGKAPQSEPTEDYVVNGKTVKLTAAQAKSYTQKGLFADQKLKSMEVLQGKTAALIEALKTPEGILKVLKDPALGASPKEVFKKLMSSDVVDDELKETMAKWVYDNVIVQSKKTPEQIEQEKRLAKLEQYEKADAERKAKELSAAQQSEVQKIYQGVRAEVTKQIVADKTFPQTEGAIRQVIEKLRVMNKNGAPISSENVGKAIGQAKKDHLLHQQAMFDTIEDPEALIAYFGEARALKISKALIARLKNKGAAKTAPKGEEETIENLDTRNSRKFGRERHGYQVLDVM